MQIKPNPTFSGLRQPNSDFLAVQTRLQTLPLYVDIDLTNARSMASGTGLQLPIAGNSVYIDQLASTGSASLHFQDDVGVRSTPIGVQAGFIAKIPFTFIVLENTAQAGKTLRLIYGVDIEFTPGVNAQVAITGGVDIGGVSKTNSQLTVTNASQTFAVADANRSYLAIQNNDASGVIYVTEDGSVATSLTGIKIPAGGFYEPTRAPTGVVNIIGSIASNANVVLVVG